MSDLKIIDNEEPNELRVVLLATPSPDGKVTAFHAASLAETVKIGLSNGINVMPIYLSYDAVIQRARNDLTKIIIENKEITDLFFIDADQDWNPSDFFKMLDHDVDVVGAPTIKKDGMEAYSVKIISEEFGEVLDNGLIQVNSVATGMMRIRRHVIEKLWESSEKYTEFGKEGETAMIFGVEIKDGELCSEDVFFCNKWIEQGGDIFIDPLVNGGHVGANRRMGNFMEWYKLAKNNR